MQKIIKSLRLHIGIFGRTNVGKSSILNLLAGQNVAITSEIAGTTTDVVEKSMELLPIGPVIFLDTAGIDDQSELGKKRISCTNQALLRSNIAIIVTENNIWNEFEENLFFAASEKKIPILILVNKIDKTPISPELKNKLADKISLEISANDKENRDFYLTRIKHKISQIMPESFFMDQSLTQGLLPENALVVLVVPIDSQAPKGRLILPQVQTIRDLLDLNNTTIVVTKNRFCEIFSKIKIVVDLVICDSQIVKYVTENTPADIKITTFSILFSKLKGELFTFLQGTKIIDKLEENDKILIAESCTHHAGHEDIGRVKIPNWLQLYSKKNLIFDIYSGHDFPENLSEYKLVIHCGGCMQNRQQMLNRLEICKTANVAITNYGLVIAKIQEVLPRMTF